MPNPVPYLELAGAAYSNEPANNVPEGYTYLSHYSNPETGYFGVAYMDANGEIVIAHRGTEIKTLPDLYTDANIVAQENIHAGIMPPQVLDALAFSQSLSIPPGASVVHTGHSLGGYLASVAASTNPNASAIVFDPVGAQAMVEHLQHEGLASPNAADRITAYMASPNYVNTVNEQIGTLYTIQGGQGSLSDTLGECAAGAGSIPSIIATAQPYAFPVSIPSTIYNGIDTAHTHSSDYMLELLKSGVTPQPTTNGDWPSLEDLMSGAQPAQDCLDHAGEGANTILDSLGDQLQGVPWVGGILDYGLDTLGNGAALAGDAGAWFIDRYSDAGDFGEDLIEQSISIGIAGTGWLADYAGSAWNWAAGNNGALENTLKEPGERIVGLSEDFLGLVRGF